MASTYKEVAELTRICGRQAHFTKNRDAARELWRMALEYQHRAVALGSGTVPDIGPPPPWFKG